MLRKKHSRGRPAIISQEIVDKIATLVANGNYMECAAAYCGVHKDTLYDWLKKGARSKSGIYREFSDAVERARAEAELRDLAVIKAASAKNWTAAAWRLERRHPERWGRRDHIIQEHTGANGAPIEVAAVKQPVNKGAVLAALKAQLKREVMDELGSDT